VSIPDRRRIDSDVRAFLREPSTPWIVFDQEGRPPSQLAVGEILKGPRRTLLSDYDFSATAAVDYAPTPSLPSRIVEPSSLAVASDLAARASSSARFDVAVPEASAIPMFGLSRRVLGASVAGFALLSMLVVGTLALRSASHDGVALRNAAVAQPATGSDPRATVPAEIPPPDRRAAGVEAPVYESQPAVAPAAAAPAPAPAAVTLSVVPPRNDASAKNGANKYGRLTIAGDARSKDVFMDGKRMLGRGARSFSVMCGPHTIAVSVRSEAQDVDIPCNAELVVGK
jgi:hypothetical protein